MSNDYTLVFESPRGHRPEDRAMFANLLVCIDHPNEEARIATFGARSTAGKVRDDLRSGRAGRTPPPGRWQFRTGKLDDGRTGLYATYLGPEGT